MTATGKLDLKKTYRGLYSAKAEPAVLDVPARPFLMIDGTGDPNTSPDYVRAIEALYSVSYGLKFAVKRGPLALDYAVMPLEGLWWADDPGAFTRSKRAAWHWTMMIMQPDVVTPILVDEAVSGARDKHPSPALDLLRLEAFEEGHAAQLLHVGPYAAEGPNIARLHAFIAAQGGSLTGKHHEIYLGDPRRSAPDKLRTIIRQPFVA